MLTKKKMKHVVIPKQPINCDGSKVNIDAKKYKRYLNVKYYSEYYDLFTAATARTFRSGSVAKEELNYFFEDYTFKRGKKVIFCVRKKDIKRLKNEK